MSRLKAYIYSLATLSGTIIGVGIFSLPYITVRAGTWVMLGYFLALGALVILIHVFFGELALQTPDFKRIPGFAKIYLGSWGQKASLVSAVLGMLGAVLAYLIVGGEFLKELLSPFLGGGTFFYTVLYFIAGAILIYFGIKAIARLEFWAVVLFFVVLLVILFRSFSKIELGNLFLKPDFGQFFLPYGPILFSLWGASLIPEAEEMLGENKGLFKKIIALSILIAGILYLFFIFLTLGITGSETTESALPGLKNFLGTNIYYLAIIFGILTTFTSFLTIGLTLKRVLNFDLRIKENMAWVITCFVPLVLFLAGFNNFIPVISFIGAVMLGFDGILILLMYRKIGRGFKLVLTYPLILVLLAGIIYEIVYFVK
jgi:tyrosine-specific transport protein